MVRIVRLDIDQCYIQDVRKRPSRENTRDAKVAIFPGLGWGAAIKLVCGQVGHAGWVCGEVAQGSVAGLFQVLACGVWGRLVLVRLNV